MECVGLTCPPPTRSFLVFREPAVQTAREDGADREPEGKRRTARSLHPSVREASRLVRSGLQVANAAAIPFIPKNAF